MWRIQADWSGRPLNKLWGIRNRSIVMTLKSQSCHLSHTHITAAKPPPPPVVMAIEDCQSGMPGHLPFVEVSHPSLPDRYSIPCKICFQTFRDPHIYMHWIRFLSLGITCQSNILIAKLKRSVFLAYQQELLKLLKLNDSSILVNNFINLSDTRRFNQNFFQRVLQTHCSIEQTQGQLIAIMNKPYDEWWEGYTLDEPDTKGLFCILLVDQQPLG